MSLKHPTKVLQTNEAQKWCKKYGFEVMQTMGFTHVYKLRKGEITKMGIYTIVVMNKWNTKTEQDMTINLFTCLILQRMANLNHLAGEHHYQKFLRSLLKLP